MKTQPSWWYAAIDSRNHPYCTQLPAPTLRPSLSLLVLDVGLRPPTEPIDVPRTLEPFSRAALLSDLIVVRGAEEQDPPRLLDEISRHIRRGLGAQPTLVALARSTVAPHRLTATVHVQGPAGWDDALKASICSAEIQAHLHRTGAIYRPNSHHFLLPSGAHSAAFVRVADALDDVSIVRRFADWVEDDATPPDAILGDTWTILPLLQELATRAESVLHREVSVWSFAEYPSLRTVRETLASILPTLSSLQTPQLLFVASGLASGDMVRRIDSFTRETLPGVRLRMVALTAGQLLVPRTTVLSQLPSTPRYSVQRGEPCLLCREPGRSALVTIDPKKYFPQFEAHVYKQMLTARDASIHSTFWEAVSQQEAAVVHTTDVTLGEPRHLHLALRIERLLRHPSLRQEVEQDLRSHMPYGSDVVIIPRHDATEQLAALARAALGEFRLVVIERASADQVDPIEGEVLAAASRKTLRESLADARRILILDDVVIRGTTVRTIHRTLQEAIPDLPEASRPRSDYEISAYAVLARPEHYYDWQLLTDSLRQSRGTRAHAYRVIPFPEDHCPWCVEQRELSRLIARLRRKLEARARATVQTPYRLLNLLQERRALLTTARGSLSQGLSQMLFFASADGDTGQRDEEILSPHSLFGERLSESATYVAVASTMHSLRDFALSQLRNQQAAVWAWDTAKIFSAYHDPLLQASFLRACGPLELVAIDGEATLASLSKEMIAKGDSGFRQSCLLATEHLWAALLGKYPSTVRERVARQVLPVVGAWNKQLSRSLSLLTSDELALQGLTVGKRARRGTS